MPSTAVKPSAAATGHADDTAATRAGDVGPAAVSELFEIETPLLDRAAWQIRRELVRIVADVGTIPDLYRTQEGA